VTDEVEKKENKSNLIRQAFACHLLLVQKEKASVKNIFV